MSTHTQIVSCMVMAIMPAVIAGVLTATATLDVSFLAPTDEDRYTYEVSIYL